MKLPDSSKPASDIVGAVQQIEYSEFVNGNAKRRVPNIHILFVFGALSGIVQQVLDMNVMAIHR